jgi:hypothetical protein
MNDKGKVYVWLYQLTVPQLGLLFKPMNLLRMAEELGKL